MKKVLVVDDSLAIRIFLTRLVSQLDLECKAVNSGLEALEYLKETIPNIIIMDIEMPTMNGIDTTYYIRQKLKLDIDKLPIVALTAHETDDLPMSFHEVGFNDFLKKPVSLKKLKKCFDNYL